MESKNSPGRYRNVSKSLLAQTIDFLPDPTFAIDLSGKVLVWNRAMEAITQVKAEDIVGRGDYAYSIPFYGERRPILIDMVFQDNAGIEKKYSYIQRKGDSLYAAEAVGLLSKRFLLGKAGPIYGNDGLMIGAIESIQDITERKLAEEALKKSEGVFRVLFNQSYHFIGLMNIDGTIIKANSTALEFAGVKESDVVGSPFWETPWWTHSEKERKRLRNAVLKAAHGDFVRFESNHLDAEEHLHIIDFSIKPVRDENNNVVLLIPEGRDITERKHAEDVLTASEARYRKLYESMMDAFVCVDMDGRITEFNEVYYKMLGYEPAELRKLTYFDITPENWHAIEAEIIEKQAMARGYTDLYEKRYRRKDGTVFPIEITTYLIRDDQGNPNGLWGIIRDITDRKRAEETLRKSEELYTSLVNTIPDIIVRTDLSGRILFVNDYALEISGYGREEIEGQNMLMFISPEDWDRVTKNAVLMMDGRLVPQEYQLVMKDGRKLPFEINGDALRNEDGTPYGLVNVCRDISERKQAEEKFSTVFMMAPDGISITRMRDGLILDINLGFQKISGWERSELLGRSALDTNIWIDPADRALLVEELQTGRDVLQREFHFRRKDCSLGIGIYSARSIQIAGESYILFVMRDITDRRRLEEERQKLEQQLIQSQKMESLGTLAGGIAHDFNNILTPIIGFAELVIDDFSKGSLTHAHLSEILTAANRASDLVSQILTFSRKSETVYSPLAIRTIIKESLKLLRSVIPSTIEIRHDLAESGLVMSNPTQIHQVIMNLCTNASQAMGEEGGVMEVSLHKVNLDQETATSLDINPGAYLRLMVSDTGHGIPPEIMERIFEPYFTTKEVGHGTGLGLSVVHGIVKSHRGTIICRSVLKEGTTFEVYLPEIESEKKVEGQFEKESIPTGTERILFIDDEAALTRLAEDMLKKLGYKVTTKTNSVEAFDLFKERPHEFDLVITDMTMPGLTGDRLAQKTMEIRPDIPVILCSGYSEHISEEKAKAIGIREFVMKPLGTKKFAETIRTVLDAR